MGNIVVCIVCTLLYCLFSQHTAFVGADAVTRHVTVGLTVTLPCSARAPADAQRLTWLSPRSDPLTRNYDRLIVDVRFSVERGYQRERNLRIENVRTTDAGVYTCKLPEQTQQTTRSTVELVVNVPPSIVNISQDARKHVGNDVILQCDATGNPQPQVTWYRVSGDMEKEVSSAGSLSLTSITRVDAGVYLCRADNGVPPATYKRVRVDVLFSPVLALPDRQMVQSVGTDALLTCLVHAFPPAELHWVHADIGDGRLPTIGSEKYRVQNWTVDEHSILFGLHIFSITAVDYGTYYCRARNDFGEDSAKLVINAPNSSALTPLPLVKCDSSTGDVLIVVIAAMAALLAAAVVALAVMLYKIRHLKLRAAPENHDKVDEARQQDIHEDVAEKSTLPASDGRTSDKPASVTTRSHVHSVRNTRL